MQVFDPRNYLVEELACFWLFNSLILNNVIEQLAAASVLHDQVELFGSLDYLKRTVLLVEKPYFIKLDYIGVPNQLENVDFSCDSLHVCDILDLVFF